MFGGDEFNHGYTYASHTVAAAVASENMRILEEEGIVDKVRHNRALSQRKMGTTG